jgi:rhamnogalacturonyl hydrolase YesR
LLTAVAIAATLGAAEAPVAAAETFAIGLTSSGAPIEAAHVPARRPNAPTVLIVGGLHGAGASTDAVRAASAAFEKRRPRDRAFNLLAVAVANPDAAPLEFPPSGVAYREHSESHALWRWIGTQAPDLVLIADDDDAGLASALAASSVAEVGTIPARRWNGPGELAVLDAAALPSSAAHRELDRRRARSPRELATELARYYGHDFDQPWYIGAIALVARIRLGDIDDVRRLVEPYVDGTKNVLANPSTLVMAGHVVFTELARRTHDPRYVAAVRRVGDLGFEPDGRMKEAMPYHNQFSDAVFMGTVPAVQAGALTGDRKYFDMADRHLAFMEKLDRRADGLYRHQPATDAAWGRGNAFAAFGLALALSDLPHDHPAYAHALASYRALVGALLPYQTRDGLWRNVIDYDGAYPEFSATAMIGFALLRGLENGWVSGTRYERAVERAWDAVNARTSSAGGMIDVCESTARMPSLDAYLKRTAILGKDPRGGAMAMLFATELMMRGEPRARR